MADPRFPDWYTKPRLGVGRYWLLNTIAFVVLLGLVVGVIALIIILAGVR